MEKKCETCNEIKPDIEFYAGKNKLKKMIHCRECRNKKSAEFKKIKRANKLKEKINQGIIKVPNDPINNYVCNGPCGQEKPKNQFRHNRKNCHDCEKKHGREYRQGDIGKQKAQKWVEENKEKMSELQANWFQKNKETINNKIKERMNTDEIYCFLKKKRSKIYYCFKDGKDEKTTEYLNCNNKYMKDWIKLNYDEKMNDENHGSYWHLDHVIPINTFDYTIEQNKHLAFGWYNMSALETSKNMNKKDKIDTQQLINHVAKLLDYVEEGSEHDTEYFKEYIGLCAKHLIKSGNPLEL
jgi:hypothetical protein